MKSLIIIFMLLLPSWTLAQQNFTVVITPKVGGLPYKMNHHTLADAQKWLAKQRLDPGKSEAETVAEIIDNRPAIAADAAAKEAERQELLTIKQAVADGSVTNAQLLKVLKYILKRVRE